MSLPEISHVKGFTLAELLVVVALMLVVGMFMFPLGIQFYRSQMLNESSEGISSALRRAQHLSRTGAYDSTFGVRVIDGGYVLFSGETYDSRDVTQDESHSLPATISITGLQEVSFELFTGNPSATGTLTVQTDTAEASVTVQDSGFIVQ